MLPGKAGDDDMAFLIRRPAMAFELGQSLQQGQGAKLERVEIERIVSSAWPVPFVEMSQAASERSMRGSQTPSVVMRKT